MRRGSGVLILIAFLLLGLGIFWIFVSEKPSDNNSSISSAFSTATPVPTATPENGASYIVQADGTVITVVGENDAKDFPEGTPETFAEFTAAPTATPEPPPTPTAVPTASPTPPPTPVPTPTPEPVYDKTGEFRSDTGCSLNLVIKWEILPPEGEDGYRLQLDAYLESYALYTGNGTNDTIFTVNGEVFYGSSTAVSTDSQGLIQNKICSAVIAPSAGNADVSVKWYFNGSYSNRQIEDIVAKGNVYIPG